MHQFILVKYSQSALEPLTFNIDDPKWSGSSLCHPARTVSCRHLCITGCRCLSTHSLTSSMVANSPATTAASKDHANTFLARGFDWWRQPSTSSTCTMCTCGSTLSSMLFQRTCWHSWETSWEQQTPLPRLLKLSRFASSQQTFRSSSTSSSTL